MPDPQDLQNIDLTKPPIGTLAKILGQSKESKQFSPYAVKKEDPIKLVKKTYSKATTPIPEAPIKTEGAPIQTDLLDPIKDISPAQNINDAIENTITKKYSNKASMPRDVYKANLKAGYEENDFIIVNDDNGYPELIRKAPTVATAFAEGWQGFFNNFKDAIEYYNPANNGTDRINLLEQRRIDNKLLLQEVESKTGEYGRLAGQTGAQVLETFLPIGSAIIGAKMAATGVGVAARMANVTIANTTLQAVIGSLSQGVSAEQEAYDIARDTGLDTKDSYDVASVGRLTYLSTGAAEGVVSALADVKIAKAFGAATETAGKGFLNATKALLTKAKAPAASLALDASVAGVGSVLRDFSTMQATGEDLDVLNRAWQNVKGELIAGGAIATIATGVGAGKRKVGKWYQSQAVNYLATLDKTFIENEFKDRQLKGEMTEEQIKTELKKIEDWKQIKKDNPDVSEEKAPTLIGLFYAKRRLTEAFLKADESSKADILVKLKELDTRIDEARTNPEQLAGEVDDITGEKIVEPTPTEVIAEPILTEVTPTEPIIQEPAKVEPIVEEAVPESFNSKEGRRVLGEMNGQIDKINFRDGNKKNALARAKKAIVAYLQTTKLYSDASDVAREQMFRDAQTHLFNKRFKTAPNADSIISGVRKKMTIDELSALNILFKKESATARRTVGWVNKTRQSISNGLAKLKSKGAINIKQFTTILKKYDKLNLSSNANINAFTDYVSKVINDANYIGNVAIGKKTRGLIKKYAKSKSAQVNLSTLAKQFLYLNPEQISDINEYNKIAQLVLDGIKPTKAKRIVTDPNQSLNPTDAFEKIDPAVEFNQAFDADEVSNYISKETLKIEENKKSSKMEDYQDLVDKGIISKDMTFEEMDDIISAIESNESKDVEDLSNKEKYIKAYIEKRFNSLSALAKSLGFPNEFGEFSLKNVSSDQKSRISELLKVDITAMSIQDGYRAIEALQNFVTNGESSGLDAILYSYYGGREAKALEMLGYGGRKFRFLWNRWAGQGLAKNFTTLPVLYVSLFGYQKAQVFKKALGLTGIEVGNATAIKMSENITTEYLAKYGKINPNNQNFLAQDNVFERGMFAFVRRNLGLSDIKNNKEFQARKNLIKQSIDELITSGDRDASLGEAYQKVYDKILKDANTIVDVESKVDVNNKEAVEWWTNKWDSHYDELKSVNLNVYNQELNKDNKYNPDIYRWLKNETDEKSDPFVNSSFSSVADNLPKKQSGTLMKSKRPENLPDKKFIDLNFDYNNKRAIKAALTDIHTAKYIAQARAFLNSDSYKKIIKGEDGTIHRKRVGGYVARIRGFDTHDPVSYNRVRRFLSAATTITVSWTLGSAIQPIKQTAPALINTLINVGPGHVNLLDGFDKDIINWINNSGRAVASRGLESDAMIESTDAMILNSKGNAYDRSLDWFEEYNKKWLKALVANPDKYAARVSFIAYYKKSLSDNGISTSNIDWKTHKINDEAADYAQTMVDIQQNVSDRDMQGDFMASREASTIFLKNLIMPLSNFIINQKARMYADLSNSFDRTATSESRATAQRSLLALSAEMIVFNSIVASSQYMYQAAVDNISGIDISEEEEKKRLRNASRAAATNFTNDLVSPMPLMNTMIDEKINWVMANSFQSETPEELRFTLYGADGKDWEDYVGLIGIGINKYKESQKSVTDAVTGDVEQEIFGKKVNKKISEEDMPLMKGAAVLKILALAKVLPSDFYNMANKLSKSIEKRAMTSKQTDAYKEIRGEGNTPIPSNSIDINENISRAISIKDPESRAKYLMGVYEKFGEKDMVSAIDALYNIETQDGKGVASKVMDKATIANIYAIKSENKDVMEVARLFSLKDQKSRVFRIMNMRSYIPKEKLYPIIEWIQGYNLLNDEGKFEFGRLMAKEVGTDSEEFLMAAKSVED